MFMRFSPTGVGNVRYLRAWLVLVPVQPHWCGERDAMKRLSKSKNGSAPLVWGTFLAAYAIGNTPRFSPTGVGNVNITGLPIIERTVQPHWCGERKEGKTSDGQAYGSAPLVWGTYPYLGQGGVLYRFSPTGVGNVY